MEGESEVFNVKVSNIKNIKHLNIKVLSELLSLFTCKLVI